MSCGKLALLYIPEQRQAIGQGFFGIKCTSELCTLRPEKCMKKVNGVNSGFMLTYVKQRLSELKKHCLTLCCRCDCLGADDFWNKALRWNSC